MAFDQHHLLEAIRERFYYDSGLVRIAKAGKWKGKVNDVAGSVRKKDGRVIIQVKRQRLFAHQVVWLLFNENLPKHSIDHVDGNPQNNSINNLRAATPVEQQGNKQTQRNNSSGYKGVSYKKHVKKCPWLATITSNGKSVHLGYFSTPEMAALAYDTAAREKFGSFAKTNF